MARTKNEWGRVVRLPDGGYAARYFQGGVAVRAPATFQSADDAHDFLLLMRTALHRGGWSLEQEVGTSVRDYANGWLADHKNLRPRTRDLYRSELKLHIFPVLGDLDLGAVEDEDVRAWRGSMVDAGKPGAPTIAKCYRLLHAIFNTAVADGLVPVNPCDIRGAGHEHAPERPVASIPDVFALANAIDPRFRAAVLLATFGSLRIGEVLALRRRSFDLDGNAQARPPNDRTPIELTVVDQLLELDDGSLLFGPPKTRSGIRSVAVPSAVRPDVERHLLRFTATGSASLLFANQSGEAVRRSDFFRAWDAARRRTGLQHLHFHDLRHTGNTYAAATGASIKELMARMGHATPRAALLYQHAVRMRDRAIAQALDEMIRAAWRAPPDADRLAS